MYLHVSRKSLYSTLPAPDMWLQSPWLLWLASPTFSPLLCFLVSSPLTALLFPLLLLLPSFIYHLLLLPRPSSFLLDTLPLLLSFLSFTSFRLYRGGRFLIHLLSSSCSHLLLLHPPVSSPPLLHFLSFHHFSPTPLFFPPHSWTFFSSSHLLLLLSSPVASLSYVSMVTW